MKARVFCIAAILAGLAGTARADGPEKPRLRFWGVEVRNGNACAHSVELDTAIAEQLEQLGTPVLARPMGGNFRAGCVGLDCVSQWPLPPPLPPIPAIPVQDPSRNAPPEPDRMLGGSVEPSSKGPWRGRLWYYVAGMKQVAVRDVVASRERLPMELAYAAAALVLAPDPTQTIASEPSFCSTAGRSSQMQSPAKSAAADGQGTYIAGIDENGTLYVYTTTINTTAGNTLTATELGQYVGYRHVTIGDGDVDGNKTMDVLALRQGGQPLVLLREEQTFNQTKKTLAEQLAARLADHTEAKAADAVATIGSFDLCDPRPDVLLASGGAVYALTQQADRSFVKQKLALDQLPASAKITALLLADTDKNGAADLLLVAVEPDTVYVYQVL